MPTKTGLPVWGATRRRSRPTTPWSTTQRPPESATWMSPVVVDDLGPVGVAAGRLLLAAATLALLLIPARRLVRRRAPLRRYLLLGAVNAAAPFTLIALAEKRLDASLAAIINATTPLFSA